MLEIDAVGEWLVLRTGSTPCALGSRYSLEMEPGGRRGKLHIAPSGEASQDRIELSVSWPSLARGELVLNDRQQGSNVERFGVVLSPDVAREAGLSPDAVPAHAFARFDDSLTTILRVALPEGVPLLACGANYEASLILLPHVWAEVDSLLDGDRVVTVPNRDLLLVTGSNNVGGIERMRRVASEGPSKSYPVFSGGQAPEEDLVSTLLLTAAARQPSRSAVQRGTAGMQNLPSEAVSSV